MDIKPIETKYKEYRFRSRLEARWAVFFDTLGVKWEYEKECYKLSDGKQYLPDFWMPTGIRDHGYFVEIKPIEPTEEERNKLLLLTDGTNCTSMCFWGAPGDDGNWRASVFSNEYGPTRQCMKNGYFSISKFKDWSNVCFVEDFIDHDRDCLRVYHLPFDYHWHTNPSIRQIDLLKTGFKAFRSARFEFGEEG